MTSRRYICWAFWAVLLALCSVLVLQSCRVERPTPQAYSWDSVVSVAKTPGLYVGSPSLAILPSGRYVASHDWFGPRTRYDTTVVFASDDQGGTWRQIGAVAEQFWSGVFVHRGIPYLMGTNRAWGDVVIRRSEDGGRTWWRPGVILSGRRYHTAPVPILVHAGRFWRAFEVDIDNDPQPPDHFAAFVISAPLDANLLDPKSWQSTNLLQSQEDWREGNMVVAPNGELLNVLRTGRIPEMAAITHVSADGLRLSFDPAVDLVSMPGAGSKFTIRRKPGGGYLAIVNERRESGDYRNRLSLIGSEDLRSWRVLGELWHDADAEHNARQYVDWQICDGSLIYVSRTAADAANAHDANQMTFHQVLLDDFRN